mmetsp:Transcript_16143/g.35758  ORF Transcript_16143/g.35758 Transcript_16143/m.35758 type:complete len:412 (-) Transcript_16143:139-1374(-)
MEIFGSAVAVILLWKRYTDQQRGSHEKSLVYLSDKCDPGLRGTALRLLKETDYKPPLYLPFEIHGQLQTCMQYSVRNISRVCMQLFRMRDLVVFDRELLTLSDGGTIALDWGSHFHADQCAPLTASSPVVILFHGLVGDSQSEYIFHMSGQLLKRGYRVVAVVARGCGGLSLTTGRVFAGRRTSDVASAIHTVADRYPSAKLFGVGFSQRRNDTPFTAAHLQNCVVGGALSQAAQRDLILASIAIKFTQSNSVGYARNGQMIGVGAGQQSRVDCVKLAGRKVAVWYLRQHPKVQALPFKKTVKRQDRVNARVRYIEGDFTSAEMPIWLNYFESAPEPLSEAEKAAFLSTLDGVSISSDAFFPFRDSIDHASKYGVQFIAQPGGSVADQEVKDACVEYGMQMAFTNLRLFLH